MSWVATRATVVTGVSHRSSSSTAEGMMAGSSTIWRRSSGCWASRAMKHSSESVTVSSPARMNKKQMPRISSTVSCLRIHLGLDEHAQRMSSRGVIWRSLTASAK